MKSPNEKAVEVINDLIQINNDRVAGYERAAKETSSEDADLHALFNKMAVESRKYINELSAHVDEPVKGTSLEGKIYRAWMDVKATFSGKDRKAILASCEFGEDAAQKAYTEALKEEDIPAEIRTLITDQKTGLKRDHDQIKRLRDMQHA